MSALSCGMDGFLANGRLLHDAVFQIFGIPHRDGATHPEVPGQGLTHAM